MTTRKKNNRKSFNVNDLLETELSSDESVASDGQKKTPTLTYGTYKTLLKSPNYVLTFQPRYTDDNDDE